jgi:hypothetical protein
MDCECYSPVEADEQLSWQLLSSPATSACGFRSTTSERVTAANNFQLCPLMNTVYETQLLFMSGLVMFFEIVFTIEYFSTLCAFVLILAAPLSR